VAVDTFDLLKQIIDESRESDKRVMSKLDDLAKKLDDHMAQSHIRIEALEQARETAH